ncbi:uncharacterized protein LOC132739674 [Ruditapes philippinarum]|uniref:uncharacterized protein LOC132739674 n=1 Tax=Ruditapes philippinarum TaxID=129788 RepID=UPI00295AA120|nr:uncharacterized protein LOC132739674 [Ruditapes philippinarum]
MSYITVTEKGVLKILLGHKQHKAACPDKVLTRLLKLCAKELAPGMTRIYQLSLDSGTLPADWKTADVSPIFKKGNRSTPSNYRPISLTSISCKILEHIIFSNIMAHFDNNNILSDSQSGFRRRRSCESQLLTTVNNLVKGLDKNEQIDAILLDFSKAFDKVSHTHDC